MGYTLLQLIDQASSEMGLTAPPAVMGSTVNQTVQLLALTNRLGRDLIREFEWEQLVRAYRFSTTPALTTTGDFTAGSPIIFNIPDTGIFTTISLVISGTGIAPYAQIASIDTSNQITMDTPSTSAGQGVTLTFAYQDYAAPADFDRMISDTNWDRTNHWRNLGTKSSQEWQTLQGGVISTGPRERFRIYGGNLRIFPALTSAYNMGFEYVSNYWVYNPNESSVAGVVGTKRPAFLLDADQCLFPDDLMLAGIKYYFLKAKKLDYGIEMAEFAEILDVRKAQDVPLPTRSLAPMDYPLLISPYSVPDGSWNFGS